MQASLDSLNLVFAHILTSLSPLPNFHILSSPMETSNCVSESFVRIFVTAFVPFTACSYGNDPQIFQLYEYTAVTILQIHGAK